MVAMFKTPILLLIFNRPETTIEVFEQVKKLQKDGASEDECKDAETAAQVATDKYIILVEKHLAAKEVEIMAV